MKKLKLKALQLTASEVLTRAHLKNIMGGDGSGLGCLSRGWACSQVTEETNCCGSGRCLPGSSFTGYVCV